MERYTHPELGFSLDHPDIRILDEDNNSSTSAIFPWPSGPVVIVNLIDDEDRS